MFIVNKIIQELGDVERYNSTETITLTSETDPNQPLYFLNALI